MSGSDRAIEIRLIARRRWLHVVAEDQGRDVSHLSLSPMPVRVGPAGQLSMAGLAGVATEPEYRRGGLAHRVFDCALEEVKTSGYSCVGLYTGADIVAHRLYRRHGFVDTFAPMVATKVLDPGQYVVNRLSALFRGDVAPELRSWRCTLQVRLLPHDPVFVRIDQGEVRLLDSPPKRLDLSLTVSAATLGQLFWSVLSADFAEAAKLVQWEGDEAHWHRLATAIEARREVIKEGSL